MTKGILESAGPTWLVRGFIFGFTLLGTALVGSPIPACGVASLSTYDAPGYECTIDGYTLEDLTFNSTQTGGATLLTDNQIMVDPTSDSTGVSFQFNGDFVSAADQTEEYIFQYELDPPLPKVTGATVVTGPGDPITLTGQFCGNGMLVGNYVAGQPTSCSGTDTSGIFPADVVVVGNNSSGSVQFPSLVTDLDSRLVLDLDGASSITSFGSTTDLSSVPEPSMAFLLAPLMLGFMLLRKRGLLNGR